MHTQNMFSRIIINVHCINQKRERQRGKRCTPHTTICMISFCLVGHFRDLSVRFSNFRIDYRIPTASMQIIFMHAHSAHTHTCKCIDAHTHTCAYDSGGGGGICRSCHKMLVFFLVNMQLVIIFLSNSVHNMSMQNMCQSNILNGTGPCRGIY